MQSKPKLRNKRRSKTKDGDGNSTDMLISRVLNAASAVLERRRFLESELRRIDAMYRFIATISEESHPIKRTRTNLKKQTGSSSRPYPNEP